MTAGQGAPTGDLKYRRKVIVEYRLKKRNVHNIVKIYKNIFVDIGDNQSIENSLSTFSSHMKNIANILNKADSSTLIISDEIGSGTEPTEGAGLAIAILEEFYKKGCITIASTHYGEIKKFAKEHPHFINAGMMFEADTLEPLYKLVIGTSEDSNALFIAQKMGINKKVLDNATKFIQTKEYNTDTIKVKTKPDQTTTSKMHNKTNSFARDFF